MDGPSSRTRRATRRLAATIAALCALATAPCARASLFSGDTLDSVANVLAWIVLIVAPVIAIAVFWIVHILPEKIAEQRRHPQASAIKTLCLLSLFFGGMLWPLAWLWAYSKPVLYKLAYGTDVAEPHDGAPSAPLAVQSSSDAAPSNTAHRREEA